MLAAAVGCCIDPPTDLNRRWCSQSSAGRENHGEQQAVAAHTGSSPRFFQSMCRPHATHWSQDPPGCMMWKDLSRTSTRFRSFGFLLLHRLLQQQIDCENGADPVNKQTTHAAKTRSTIAATSSNLEEQPTCNYRLA